MSTNVETDGQGGVRLNIEYNPSDVAKEFIEDSGFVTGFFGPL